MTSQDTGRGWVCRTESCCIGLPERGAPVTVVASGIVRANCTRVGCYWRRVGCTSGRWGLRAVRTPLASGSRPSWSRPTRADSGRDSRWGRSRTLTTGPQRRRRAGVGGGGPVTDAPGCAARTPDSFLRCPVSTALTLPSLPPKRPAGIVGMLRFFTGVQARFGVNVSAVDTDAPPDLFPSSRPRPKGHRPAQGSRPSRCLRTHDTHMSQK